MSKTFTGSEFDPYASMRLRDINSIQWICLLWLSSMRIEQIRYFKKQIFSNLIYSVYNLILFRLRGKVIFFDIFTEARSAAFPSWALCILINLIA